MSGRIFQKAQQERARKSYQKMLDKLEGLEAGDPEWKAALREAVDELTKATEQTLAELESKAKNEAWDFSAEKSQTVIASDDVVSLSPIVPSDEEWYIPIRLQYSLSFRALYETAKDKIGSLFASEALAPEVFYCSIRIAETDHPIGYLGIKDTRTDLWEIAVELDKEYTRRGLGPRSIKLYLNEVQRVTGKTEFRALVEADNIPSQKCFERLGAQFAGLHESFMLKTEEERIHFEENNLDLIDENIRELAKRLGVEPRKLLSHLLDYRIALPTK